MVLTCWSTPEYQEETQLIDMVLFMCIRVLVRFKYDSCSTWLFANSSYFFCNLISQHQCADSLPYTGLSTSVMKTYYWWYSDHYYFMSIIFDSKGYLMKQIADMYCISSKPDWCRYAKSLINKTDSTQPIAQRIFNHQHIKDCSLKRHLSDFIWAFPTQDERLAVRVMKLKC